MIADAIRQAQQMHRKALEQTYDGLCNIYEYQKQKDEKTKLTKSGEIKTSEDVPCRLSFTNVAAAQNRDGISTISQTIKLFLAPEIKIKAGSKLVVTQNGVTTAYKQSGVPAVYASHQEILLELFDTYA